MASENRIDVGGRSAVGAERLKQVLGRRLVGLTRYVLGFGQSADEQGHGITELEFDFGVLVLRPGLNEDYILIEEGPPSNLDGEYWTRVEIQQVPDWLDYLDLRIEAIDVYSDGREDVAIVFHLEDGKNFSIVLCDGDLMMAEALEPFDSAFERVVPRLRERLIANLEEKTN